MTIRFYHYMFFLIFGSLKNIESKYFLWNKENNLEVLYYHSKTSDVNNLFRVILKKGYPQP
jgi:hypothetical protein